MLRLALPSLLPPHRLPFLSRKSSNTKRARLSSLPLRSSPADPPRPKESLDLELLDKPSPLPNAPTNDDPNSRPKPPDLDEALAPFLKFFKDKDADAGGDAGGSTLEPAVVQVAHDEVVGVELYEPKPGDLVVGVVVSGNENRMDVNVGADMLGTMLTKEVLPLYGAEMEALVCDLEKEGEELGKGRIGIVRDEEALEKKGRVVAGRPVVDAGTVVFAEVIGRTLSGRPLLSSRRLYRRVSWHRVRQIKQFNEPFKVKIFEWNTGGLLTRIEGLRAFLPKAELMNRIKNFTDLKENVGRWMYVVITKIDEESNDLIISEREAWDMMHLKEGSLLEGTVRKVLPFGVEIRIDGTNRSGLLHISNITHARVPSVSDIFSVGDKVKALVVKSMFPDKISLSTADLESEPGLFLSNKEKVFSEAEEMAQKFRQKLPVVSAPHSPDLVQNDVLPFDDEPRLYANWKWFKFERHNELSGDEASESIE